MIGRERRRRDASATNVVSTMPDRCAAQAANTSDRPRAGHRGTARVRSRRRLQRRREQRRSAPRRRRRTSGSSGRAALSGSRRQHHDAPRPRDCASTSAGRSTSTAPNITSVMIERALGRDFRAGEHAIGGRADHRAHGRDLLHRPAQRQPRRRGQQRPREPEHVPAASTMCRPEIDTMW